MSIDLTGLIQEKVGSVLSGYATSQLGESPTVASKAVGLVLPALLGKLSGMAGDNNKLTQLFNLITGPQIDATVTAVQPGLLEQGRGLLASLLGDTSGLTNLLAGKTGMSTGNTGSLLAAGLPLLLGALRSHVQTNNLTQPQFANLLSGQRGFIERLLGADFLGTLGLGAVGAGAAAAATAATHERVTPPPAAPVRAAPAPAPAPSGGGWMKWLWLALAAILALLLLKFCGKKPDNSAPPAPASAQVAPAPAVVPSAPASVAASAVAAPASAPASAAVAAGDSAKYENGVLSVYFATGNTKVNTAAADAVSADIVAQGTSGKKLVVSGFNDPRGDKAKNAELSKNRAKSVKEYLIGKGVPEAAIELRKPAETTGDSATLAQDRRVDVKAE